MPDDAVALWDAVLERGVEPCGLGARDTLRLEVCYPLHGSDISAERTADRGRPRLGLCAREGLHRGRRPPSVKGGASRAAGGLRHGRPRGCPVQGMRIAEGGEVTSGTLSPMLDVGIGLGYVPADLASPGHGDHDRPWAASSGAYRPEALLQARGAPVAAAESYPDDLRYHPEHDWARVEGDVATLGITWYAQDCPRRDRPLRAARGGLDARQGVRSYGEVESVKAVIGCHLAALGRGRRGEPEGRRRARGRQRGPLRRGWLVRIRLSIPAELDELLDVAAYPLGAAPRRQ